MSSEYQYAELYGQVASDDLDGRGSEAGTTGKSMHLHPLPSENRGTATLFEFLKSSKSQIGTATADTSDKDSWKVDAIKFLEPCLAFVNCAVNMQTQPTLWLNSANNHIHHSDTSRKISREVISSTFYEGAGFFRSVVGLRPFFRGDVIHAGSNADGTFTSQDGRNGYSILAISLKDIFNFQSKTYSMKDTATVGLGSGGKLFFNFTTQNGVEQNTSRSFFEIVSNSTDGTYFKMNKKGFFFINLSCEAAPATTVLGIFKGHIPLSHSISPNAESAAGISRVLTQGQATNHAQNITYSGLVDIGDVFSINGQSGTTLPQAILNLTFIELA